MIEITDKLVDHLAHLSRLTIEDSKKKAIQQDLQDIIGFMEKLEELNTDGIEPLTHISPRSNVLRKDEIQGSIDRKDALKNAPKTDGTFFEVPKVIQK